MRKINVRVTSLLTFEFDDNISDEEIEDYIINKMKDKILYYKDIDDIEIDF